MESDQYSEKDFYYYFSYGSNMLKERIQINDPQAIPLCPAKLEVSGYTLQMLRDYQSKNIQKQGYRLDFNYNSLRWQGAVANIVESPGSEVWGVVWIKHNDTIASLDEYGSDWPKG